MYCFAKMCCMCLSTVNKRNLKSIRNKCRDNMSILDKINFMFPKKFQFLVKCVLPDAFICSGCRNNIVRSYKFMQQCLDNIDVIKRYAAQLGHNYGSTADLNVCLNEHTSKNKGVKCNVKKEYNFSIPSTIEKENIHNTFSDIESRFIKEECNNKQEPKESINIKTETQNEELDYLVTETTLKSEITVKDEYSLDINNSVDHISFLHRFIKENDINDEHLDSMPTKTEAVENEVLNFQTNHEMNSLSFICYKSVNE